MVALKRAGCFSLKKKKNLLGSLVRFLGEENSLDVGEDSTLSNGDSSEELVQLFVITDGQLKMTGDDPGLLVVTGSIASQLEDFSSQVFHDSSHVDWGTSTDTRSIVSLAEQTVDTSNGELKTSTAGPALCLSLNFASFTTSRHVELFSWKFRIKLTPVWEPAAYIPSERFCSGCLTNESLDLPGSARQLASPGCSPQCA